MLPLYSLCPWLGKRNAVRASLLRKESEAFSAYVQGLCAHAAPPSTSPSPSSGYAQGERGIVSVRTDFVHEPGFLATCLDRGYTEATKRGYGYGDSQKCHRG